MRRLLLLISLLIVLVTLSAEQYVVNQNQNEVNLISSNDSQIQLEMTLGHFNREAVRINGENWYNLNLKKEGLTLEAGFPQVPTISRSVIIPGTARMELNVLNAEYTDIVMQVAPSKGNLLRNVNPDEIPYTFDSFYSSNGSYPQSLTELTEPFIIRDYRGITIRFKPFVYYPQTRTLRIYTKIRIALNNTGTDYTNAMLQAKDSYSAYFENIYRGLFLNFNQAKYPVLNEEGRVLVIKNSMFDTAMQPWVNWKRQKGLQVDVVDVSVAGPSANQIKTYIQNEYNLNNGLMFVQIFGDAPQVPTLTSGGGGSDPSYTLLAGGDNYPEIFIGRFSATTVAELETQIQRVLLYERDLQDNNVWAQKATGIASNQGGGSQGDLGESDQVHIENIRTDLLGYGYTTVDQIYEAQGATIAQVSNAINNGRGFLNYCGHGSDTSWGTTGFSNTNVNQLTNDNKWPFIVSIACVNGNFVSQTCFAEAWVRAKNSATQQPTGAIVFWGSSINQSWNPPMRAQDEVTDLMIAHSKNTIGGLFTNGASKMIEIYGTDGASMHKTWIIFGDATMMVRTKDPTPLTATYSPVLFIGMNTFTAQTVPGARVAVSHNGALLGTAIADATGNVSFNLNPVPDTVMDLTVTITAMDRITHIGTVSVLPSSGPYVSVDNMVVSDQNNNIPETGEMVVLNLALTNVGSDTANNVHVTISTDDEYLTIINPQQEIGNILTNATVNTPTGFSVQISNTVPDQHSAIIHIAITDAASTTWEYNRSFTINAPAFTFGNIQVNDSDGNNNGRIDAGETVTLTIPITNSGHAGATDLMTSLIINGVTYIEEPIIDNYSALPPSGVASMIYQLTFSSQVPAGTSVPVLVVLAAGSYAASQTYNVVVGQVMEDFESGTLTAYPWAFTGGNWLVVNTGAYAGTYCVQSADIGSSSSTTMSVTMNVPENGTISFYKKVSSEQNYDYLKFYINGILKNQWSGTVAWSQESYAVTAGNNVFKWEYMKDTIVDSGSDCAWLDNIVFPTTGGTVGVPHFSIDNMTVDFGSHISSEFTPQMLTIENTGTAVMIGSITATDPFFICPTETGTYTSALNYIVQPGDYVPSVYNFYVKVVPGAQLGVLGGVLTITSDDPQNLSTLVSLTAIALPVSNQDLVLPVVTTLQGNYPNPFNPRTTIKYSIKETVPVKIEIFNLKGQLVKTLVNETKATGSYSVDWLGTDYNNQKVTSGVYFYKMYAGKYSSTRKMILMK